MTDKELAEGLLEAEIQKMGNDLGFGSQYETDKGRTGWGKARRPKDPWSVSLWVWRDTNPPNNWWWVPADFFHHGVGPYKTEYEALKALHELWFGVSK